MGKQEGYFPQDSGPGQIDAVSSPHVSAGFLVHLAFNRFVLNVPCYREMYRLNDHGMFLIRKTLVNRFEKGVLFTKELVETLKNIWL